MRSYPGASGGRMAHILAVFSLSLLLLGLLALPTSALPKSSPSLAGTTYTVNSTADPGDGTCDLTECTLREAMAAALVNPGTDTVAFDIPDSDLNYGHNTAGVWTIILASPLSGPAGDTVDGTTQAANYGPDTNPDGPEIEISGEGFDPGYSCWILGSGNTIKGLVINRCPAYGIASGADDNTIIGNYIGTDATGTADQGIGIDGILLGPGAENNTIGGPSDAERNIISANNACGIRLFGATTTGNLIEGNYIGTDRTGTTPLGNGLGIEIHADAHDNTIGPDNIIAYNDSHGVWVYDATTTGNTITQNSIHSNTGLGIYNWNGGNAELSPPAILCALSDEISGTAPPNSTVEVFTGPDEEGKTYLATVSADGFGNWSAPGPFILDTYVTATATDGAGNTSEFSVEVTPGTCLQIFLPLIMKNYSP